MDRTIQDKQTVPARPPDRNINDIISHAHTVLKTRNMGDIIHNTMNELVDYRTLLLWMKDCRADLLEKHPAPEILESLDNLKKELKGVMKKKGTLEEMKDALQEYEETIARTTNSALVAHAKLVEQDIRQVDDVLKALKDAALVLQEYRKKIDEVAEGRMHLIMGKDADKRIEHINDILDILRPLSNRA